MWGLLLCIRPTLESVYTAAIYDGSLGEGYEDSCMSISVLGFSALFKPLPSVVSVSRDLGKICLGMRTNQHDGF